jgi:hypothetical protein
MSNNSIRFDRDIRVSVFFHFATALQRIFTAGKRPTINFDGCIRVEFICPWESRLRVERVPEDKVNYAFGGSAPSVFY